MLVTNVIYRKPALLAKQGGRGGSRVRWPSRPWRRQWHVRDRPRDGKRPPLDPRRADRADRRVRGPRSRSVTAQLSPTVASRLTSDNAVRGVAASRLTRRDVAPSVVLVRRSGRRCGAQIADSVRPADAGHEHRAPARLAFIPPAAPFFGAPSASRVLCPERAIGIAREKKRRDAIGIE